MQEGWRKYQLRYWLALVGTAALVLGAAYVMVQQSVRLSLNDAPQAAAQAAAQKIDDDIAPADIVPEEEVNLRTDSSVFLIITDSSGEVLASSAVLDDEAPTPAANVYAGADQQGKDSFTWQPKKGVRLATHILKYDQNGGGYIIAGQSLKSTEERLQNYMSIAGLTWLAVVAWSAGVMFMPVKNTAAKTKNRLTK